MNYQGNEALRADVAQLANTMFELRERLRAMESTWFWNSCVIACDLTTHLHFTWRPFAFYLTIANKKIRAQMPGWLLICPSSLYAWNLLSVLKNGPYGPLCPR